MEKLVELNGIKRDLYSGKAIELFEKIKNIVEGIESNISNFNIDLDFGSYVEFKTDDEVGQFEVDFDLSGKVSSVKTTMSNQELTYDFMELAKVLYELKG